MPADSLAFLARYHDLPAEHTRALALDVAGAADELGVAPERVAAALVDAAMRRRPDGDELVREVADRLSRRLGGAP